MVSHTLNTSYHIDKGGYKTNDSSFKKYIFELDRKRIATI